jgi:hypothetical protein
MKEDGYWRGRQRRWIEKFAHSFKGTSDGKKPRDDEVDVRITFKLLLGKESDDLELIWKWTNDVICENKNNIS